MKKLILMTLFVQIIAAKAATYLPQGSVEFTAKGFPTFITIKGRGEGITGVLEMEENELLGATIQFPLNTLKTGMDLRDEHMHEKYLETKKYPNATLTITKTSLKDSGSMEGILKLHNVSKNVTIHYEAEGRNPLVTKAYFSIVLGDFGIDIPSFQGITVAKEIKVEVALRAQKK